METEVDADTPSHGQVGHYQCDMELLRWLRKAAASPDYRALDDVRARLTPEVIAILIATLQRTRRLAPGVADALLQLNPTVTGAALRERVYHVMLRLDYGAFRCGQVEEQAMMNASAALHIEPKTWEAAYARCGRALRLATMVALGTVVHAIFSVSLLGTHVVVLNRSPLDEFDLLTCEGVKLWRVVRGTQQRPSIDIDAGRNTTDWAITMAPLIASNGLAAGRDPIQLEIQYAFDDYVGGDIDDYETATLGDRPFERVRDIPSEPTGRHVLFRPTGVASLAVAGALFGAIVQGLRFSHDPSEHRLIITLDVAITRVDVDVLLRRLYAPGTPLSTSLAAIDWGDPFSIILMAGAVASATKIPGTSDPQHDQPLDHLEAFIAHRNPVHYDPVANACSLRPIAADRRGLQDADLHYMHALYAPTSVAAPQQLILLEPETNVHWSQPL